jgi:hypothetical protein
MTSKINGINRNVIRTCHVLVNKHLHVHYVKTWTLGMSDPARNYSGEETTWISTPTFHPIQYAVTAAKGTGEGEGVKTSFSMLISSTLGGCDWSALRSGRFNLEQPSAPLGSLVGTKAALHTLMAMRLLALRAGRPLPPQEDSWYSFLLESVSTPGP